MPLRDHFGPRLDPETGLPLPQYTPHIGKRGVGDDNPNQDPRTITTDENTPQPGPPDMDPPAPPPVGPPLQSGHLNLGGLNGFPTVNLADYMHALQGSRFDLTHPDVGGVNGVAGPTTYGDVGRMGNSGGYGLGNATLDNFTYAAYGAGGKNGAPPPAGGPPPPPPPPKQPPPPAPPPAGPPVAKPSPEGPRGPPPAPPPQTPGDSMTYQQPDDENRYRGLRSSFTEGF